MPELNAPRPKGSSGRPRDHHIDESIIGATLEILAAEGYGGVSVEAVARLAGTSRPAIYRRWKGRAPLVLAAIADRLEMPVPPDTGCTLCDIGDSFEVFLGAYRTISPEVLSGLYADCAADPELRARYLATVVEPARTAVGSTIDRAVTRGDLRSDVDRDLVLDLVASLVHYRAMFGPHHLNDQDAERAIETLLKGAAVDYSALLEHSESLYPEHFSTIGTHIAESS